MSLNVIRQPWRGVPSSVRSFIFLRAPCHGQRDIFTSGEKPSEQSRTVQAEREIARRIREREIVCVSFRSSYRDVEFAADDDDGIAVGGDEALVERKKVDPTVLNGNGVNIFAGPYDLP